MSSGYNPDNTDWSSPESVLLEHSKLTTCGIDGAEFVFRHDDIAVVYFESDESEIRTVFISCSTRKARWLGDVEDAMMMAMAELSEREIS